MIRSVIFVAVAAPVLAASAPDAPVLKPGLWEVENAPGVAKLDGVSLGNLPYTAPPPEPICLTPEQAAKPAQWLARDTPADCSISNATITGNIADIRGTCPPPDSEAEPDGTLAITGLVEPERYDLTFETVVHGGNGLMEFSGSLTARRIGDCPA